MTTLRPTRHAERQQPPGPPHGPAGRLVQFRTTMKGLTMRKSLLYGALALGLATSLAGCGDLGERATRTDGLRNLDSMTGVYTKCSDGTPTLFDKQGNRVCRGDATYGEAQALDAAEKAARHKRSAGAK